MHQILESIAIALRSIWANKLRSFMTVLGNIVAVTSIVTVVSLIQGMNAMVSNAIVTDVGADAFTIQRLPPVRTAEDERAHAQQSAASRSPRPTPSARFSPNITSVMAQAQRRGTVTYRDQVLENIQIQGVTTEYLDFAYLRRGARPDDERRPKWRAIIPWCCSGGTWPTSSSAKSVRSITPS